MVLNKRNWGNAIRKNRRNFAYNLIITFAGYQRLDDVKKNICN
jgi:hypothetical protein